MKINLQVILDEFKFIYFTLYLCYLLFFLFYILISLLLRASIVQTPFVWTEFQTMLDQTKHRWLNLFTYPNANSCFMRTTHHRRQPVPN